MKYLITSLAPQITLSFDFRIDHTRGSMLKFKSFVLHFQILIVTDLRSLKFQTEFNL